MGDVIDICGKLRMHNLPEVDPDIEITVTMTIGTALALMDTIDQREQDYMEDEHTPLLEDVYMSMQCEIWPDEEYQPPPLFQNGIGQRRRGVRVYPFPTLSG